MDKIWRIFFATLLIALLITQGIFAEQENITLVGEAYNGYPEEIMENLCAIGDTLYLKGRNIYQWKSGEIQLSLYCEIYPPQEELGDLEEPPMFHGLVNFGGILMTLDGRRGILCEVRKDEIIPTEYKVDVESFPDSAGDLNSDMERIQYMFESEGRLFLVGYVSETQQNINSLYEVNIKTGDITPLTDKTEHIISATPYNDEEVLIATPEKDGYVRFRIWDIVTSEYREDSYIPIKNHGVEAVAYDAQRDIIYMVVGNQVYKTHWGTAPEVVNYLDREYHGNTKGTPVLIGDSIAVCAYDGTRVYSVDLAKLPKRVLTIMGDYYVDNEILGRFSARNPHIALKRMDGMIYLDMMPTLIASGQAPDIFVFESYSGLDALIDKGYAMDISDDIELMGLVSQLYPQLQEYLLRDGKLIGYPAHFSVDIWNYNAEGFEELGLREFPETMEELIDLVALWENEYADEYPNKRLIHFENNPKNELFDMMLDQYVALNEREEEPIRFDTPEFRALMEKLDAIPLKYATAEEEEQREMGISYYGYEYVEPLINRRSYIRSFLNLPMTLAFQPRISTDSPPVATANVSVYVINPHTNNRDIALQYIRFIANEGRADQQYMMNPSLNEPVESEYYKQEREIAEKEYEAEKNLEVDTSKQRQHEAGLAQMEHYINVELESQRWDIRPEHIEQYRALAPSIRIWQSNVLYNRDTAREMDRIMSRYRYGLLSVDQMIRELDQKAQMIYLESR